MSSERFDRPPTHPLVASGFQTGGNYDILASGLGYFYGNNNLIICILGMLFIYGCVPLCGGTRPIICILGIFAGKLSGWLGWALLRYWGVLSQALFKANES